MQAPLHPLLTSLVVILAVCAGLRASPGGGALGEREESKSMLVVKVFL